MIGYDSQKRADEYEERNPRLPEISEEEKERIRLLIAAGNLRKKKDLEKGAERTIASMKENIK